MVFIFPSTVIAAYTSSTLKVTFSFPARPDATSCASKFRVAAQLSDILDAVAYHKVTGAGDINGTLSIIGTLIIPAPPVPAPEINLFNKTPFAVTAAAPSHCATGHCNHWSAPATAFIINLGKDSFSYYHPIVVGSVTAFV